MAEKPENPVTTHFEFGGVLGAPFMLLSLPLTTYALYFLCPNASHCSILEVPPLPSLSSLFSLEAIGVFVAWFALQVLFYNVLPGDVGEGLPIKRLGGKRLKYKFNGLNALYASLVLYIAVVYLNLLPVVFVYDQFVPLLSAAILFSYALSVYLYASSFKKNALLAEGGNSGHPIYDFFIGRELNPRIGSFDLKYFCELRPGLIGWMLINFSLALKQYALHGSITNSMMLVCAFQGWYVYDALLSEPAILSTMDIVQDGFGFMLAFGDLAWVPFVYSLQARYLVDHPVNLSWPHFLAVIAVQALGYAIFRGANGQKDAFRRNPADPALAHLKTLQTKRGTALLVSGWWGYARHINYLGDLLMGLSWCLPTGFGTPLTYFYFIYFAILLIHRDRRDDHNCAHKYGEDWEKYKKLVPYRILPYVY
eukprot:m.225158 g.225158  ORF g.225158 m.225158 type:complete len:423 (+) comp11222_c0_seq1:25-1293(+)